MHPVDRRATSVESSRKLAGWRLAGLAMCLAALPVGLAQAYDGRRMTLGANRPMDEPPIATVPYDQAAAMPTYPPLSRPAEAIAPGIAAAPTPAPAAAQTAADTAPIQVTPSSKPGETVSTAHAQPARTPKVAPPAAAPTPVKTAASEGRRNKVETKVSGPGTKVAARDGHVRVDAPSANVAVRDNGRVRVNAPGTHVAVDDGRVRVKAPFVDLDIRF